MRRLPFLIIVFVIILFTHSASALSCSPTFFSQTFNTTQIPSTQIPVTLCNNLGGNLTNIIIQGTNSQYFTLFEDTIGNAQKTIYIMIAQDIIIGNYPLSLEFGGIPMVNLLFTIQQISQTNNPSPSSCQLNSNILQYNQIFQQGAQLTERVNFIPQNCPQNVLANAVITGGIVVNQGTTSIRKPVRISSIEQNAVNLIIDTEGLNSQTYQSQLVVNDFILPISITVTGGTSTSTNFNVNNLPSCSLSNNALNVNSSYSLICSNLIPDVTIIPRIDNNYIIGTNVVATANQFSWQFTPKRFGNTFINADFYYLGVPVGEPFRQEVTIQAGNNVAPGTELELLFSPSLESLRNKESVIIQLIDNKSKSLVESPLIYIDGTPLTNQSGKSFFSAFEVLKNYTIRATAPGYNDLVVNIKLSEKKIQITITPLTGDTKTIFNISTDSNATIYINGESKGDIYSGSLQVGENIIEAFKDGFQDSKINISIEESLIATLTTEFKKGRKQVLTLNEDANWEVQQSNNEGEIITLVSGTGTIIEFEPKDYGAYSLISSNETIWSYNLQKEGLKINNIWGWAIAVILVIGLLFYFRRNGKNKEVPFGGSVQV